MPPPHPQVPGKGNGGLPPGQAKKCQEDGKQQKEKGKEDKQGKGGDR